MKMYDFGCIWGPPPHGPRGGRLTSDLEDPEWEAQLVFDKVGRLPFQLVMVLRLGNGRRSRQSQRSINAACGTARRYMRPTALKSPGEDYS